MLDEVFTRHACGLLCREQAGKIVAGVSCRLLKDQDFAEVRALMHTLDCEHAVYEPDIFARPKFPSLTQVEYRKWVSVIDYKLWGAFSAESLVGFLLLKIRDAPSSDFVKTRRYAYIDPIVIAPDCHRQGVGRKLFMLAKDYAEAQGCSSFELAVWEGNQGARAFYEALGFRTLQRRMIHQF